jgi:hypothetical protein
MRYLLLIFGPIGHFKKAVTLIVDGQVTVADQFIANRFS